MPWACVTAELLVNATWPTGDEFASDFVYGRRANSWDGSSVQNRPGRRKGQEANLRGSVR